MIRFIDIGGQINEENNDFAFYDTIRDEFIKVEGEQVFHSYDHFAGLVMNGAMQKRCQALIPQGYLTHTTDDG